MTTLEQWWSESGAKAKKTPEYKAEALAIDVAIQVNSRLRELNISQKQLSERLKVSKAYVSQLLQGTSNMTLLTLCKVADAIDLKLIVSMRPKRDLPHGTRISVGESLITSAVSSMPSWTFTAAHGTPAWVSMGVIGAAAVPPTNVIEEGIYGRAAGT